MKLSSLTQVNPIEAEGKWMEFHGDVKLRIAPANNPSFDEFVKSKLGKEVTRRKGLDFNDPKVKKVVDTATAKFILLDWEGVTDDDGAPVEYTEQVGIESLQNHRFAKEVKLMSDELAAEITESLVDDQGN